MPKLHTMVQRIPGHQDEAPNILFGFNLLAPSITSDSLKTNPAGELLNTSAFKPITKVFALANIKCLKLVATIYNGFDSNTSDSYASSDRQFMEFEKVETNTSK